MPWLEALRSVSGAVRAPTNSKPTWRYATFESNIGNISTGRPNLEFTGQWLQCVKVTPSSEQSTPDLKTRYRVVRDRACHRNGRLADLPTLPRDVCGRTLSKSKAGGTERGTTSANQRATRTAKPPVVSVATSIGRLCLTFCDLHEGCTP
jgi:hypothetical protein